jgi:nanoRNase/pAp phosphatase (c-di-AMP/oligoRNAs hydrolase)
MSTATAQRRLARLRKAIGHARRVLVLTHDNPDPDALSSAWALRALLRHGAPRRTVEIAYGGLIGRPENRAMVKQLAIPLLAIERLALDRYDGFALVDSQPETGNNSLPVERTPDIVIDHHPLREETRAAKFHDVRPRYGATATILGEYLDAAGARIDRALATALFFGVKSETLDLSRETTPKDVAFYRRLIDRVDRALLSRIEHAPLSPNYLDWLRTAIDATERHGKLAIATVGALDYPDRVAEFADIAIRLGGIEWVVVVGRFEEALYLSVRTTRQRGAGQMVRKIVGELGKAGGHGSMAGGKVPIAGGRTAGYLELELARRARELLS